jgi:hypothetical protein
MPPAIRSFPPDIPSPVTQASLIAGLRDGLIAAGFPAPLKSYTTGTDLFVIWRLDFDPTKAFGRCFYRLRVTSALLVSHMISANFTDSTNTLVNPSSDSHSTSYLSNVPVKMWGFRLDEGILLSVSQGSTHQLLGYFRFFDCAAFDESSFPRCFISRTDTAGSLTCTGLSPYGTNLLFSNSLENIALSNADPYLQLRTLMLGILLYAPSNNGITGRSTDDFASGACVGMVRGDTLQNASVTPAETFLLLKPGAGALLIRV